KTGVKGPVKVRVERITHPAMPEDTPKPAQEERVVEVTYETLGSLVQRFHDHTQVSQSIVYRLLREFRESRDIRLLGLNRQSLF
ncbi:hypothetical protein Tco_0609751, partial [Tanacetum coccineum]